MFALLRWLVVWPDARPEKAPPRSWLGWLVTTIQGALGLSTWRRRDGTVRGPLVWLLRTIQGVLVRVAGILLMLGLTGYLILRGSLPDLEGPRTLPGLSADVLVERDAQSIPTITASHRRDLFAGLGYVHAQERFFQMDLSRKYAAGELASLLGPAALPVDEFTRPLRLRETVKTLLRRLTPAQRGEVDAYVWGVNAGLKNLSARPFEYLMLQTQPEPWTAEDTGLVVLAITIMLQADNWAIERHRAIAHDTLPKSLYELLDARGTSWDSPIDGSPAFETPRLPTPDEIDLRQRPPAPLGAIGIEPLPVGSNNWAVAGSVTRHGGAILANDMHLGIRVPNTWFRAGLVWKARDGSEMKAWGATYPGTPGLVVGSNRHVAWGLTNSEIDSADLVRIERHPQDTTRYRTPEGFEAFTEFEEELKVRGQPSRTLPVRWTRWGPVLGDERFALKWIAHQTEGFNLGWLDLLDARSLDEIHQVANRTGGPHQNFVAADSTGDIGWTLLGRIPKRVGFDGRLPVSWADGTRRWDGFLDPKDNPRILKPENGRLWTANNRVVGGADLAKLGESGYDRGARAGQIRDALLALDRPGEDEVFAIMADDRALFLARWRDLLARTLESTKSDEGSAWMLNAVKTSSDRASAGSVGYRLVLEFREEVFRRTLSPLVADCLAVDPKFDPVNFRQREGAVWKLVQEKPAHLLDRAYADWGELLDRSAREVLAKASKEPGARGAYTWGARNISRVDHPLGAALASVPQVGPWLAGWVNMPPRSLDGAWSDLPRIQSPRAGASQRMAVSPGKEELGYFQMPCGQSGHPLSPHYRDMHEAWCTATPTPFLPGPAVHRLTLQPRE